MNTTQIFPVIIIGSGPAGLTSALYAARAGMKPLVFEGSNPGGQLTGTALIENWPGIKGISGFELMAQLKEHALSAGAVCIPQEIISTQLSSHPFLLLSSDKIEYFANTLIVSTGATHKKLECTGEEEYWGKGVTTCAVCDGVFFKDMPVVIAGGGNTGAENALFMTRFTKNITIIHRSSELSCTQILKERIVESPDIKIYYDSVVSSIKGDGKKVTSVIIQNNKRVESLELETSAVFVSIGTQPNSKLISSYVACDQRGYIKTLDDGVTTSIPGVFVAGDVVNSRHRQAIVSAGMGCIAALEAERFHSNLNK